MSLSEWVEVTAVCASVVITGGGVIAAVEWLRHGRHKRRALDDALLGRPASPGFPAQPGLPERMTSMEDRLATGDTHFAEIDARLTEQDKMLKAIVDELPKNGMPLSAKIDALYRQMIAGGGAPDVHVHLDQPPAAP